MRPLIDRFAEKLQINYETGCWEWIAGKDLMGYGVIGLGRKSEGDGRASRVAYELFVGPIPDGLFVCHHCDNPSCCNPKHLFVGTHLDNVRDKCQKGRQRGAHQGEEHHNSKLSNADVIEIRALSEFGVPQSKIADVFFVNSNCVSRIVNRKRWAHI
jgi:hypothetical protein